MRKLQIQVQSAMRRYELEKNNGKRLTHQALADKMGISRQTVSNWVNGNFSEFKLDTLEKLCRALECRVEDILQMVEVEEPA